MHEVSFGDNCIFINMASSKLVQIATEIQVGCIHTPIESRTIGTSDLKCTWPGASTEDFKLVVRSFRAGFGQLGVQAFDQVATWLETIFQACRPRASKYQDCVS
jgi:hypothetical protein